MDTESALLALLPELRRFARLVLGDEEKADDAVAEALRRFQIRGSKPADPWPLRLAMLGETTKVLREEDAGAGGSPAAEIAEPVRSPRPDAARVRDAFPTLAVEKRLVLALSSVLGLVRDDCAAIMDMRVDEVQRLVAEGRTALIFLCGFEEAPGRTV